MARPKGFKLSKEQKAKMQEGRRLAKAKALEGMIEGQEVKKVKKAIASPVYGWGIENNKVVPVFNSESNTYKGKIYKTITIAVRNISKDEDK